MKEIFINTIALTALMAVGVVSLAAIAVLFTGMYLLTFEVFCIVILGIFTLSLSISTISYYGERTF